MTAVGPFKAKVTDFAICDFLVNNFAQSNLRRGPRRGTVVHVRRKVPIGYNGAPQSSPNGPITKPHYPWTRPTYDAKRHPDPICRFSTMHWTARRTYGRTHGPTHRPTTRKLDHYRPLRYDSDAAE